MAPKITALLVALMLCGCGDASYIILIVNGELAVPGEIDALEIQMLAPVDSRELANKSIDVDRDLPVEVAFTPGEDTPTVVEVHVRGTLGGEQIARSDDLFEWRRDVVNEVTVHPLEPL